MPFIVHLNATVLCTHAGIATPIVVDPRVQVSSNPITLLTSPYAIAGCALTGTPAPPCVTGTWISAATRVFAGGIPVLLFDSLSTCIASGTPMIVVMTQTRVNGT